MAVPEFVRRLKFSIVVALSVCLLPTIGFADTFGGLAMDNATVQPSGPRSGTSGKAFFNVEGSSNGAFASYGVIDFQFAAPTATQVSITSFSIDLVESNAAFTNAGALVFSLDSSAMLADIQPGTSPLAFDGTDPGTATDVTDGDLTLIPLGGGAFTGTIMPDTSGTVDNYSFSLSGAAEAELLNRLNNGGVIRIVVAPEFDPAGPSTVAATWAGFTNSTFAGPTIHITSVPEPSSLVLLGLAPIWALVRRRR